MKKIVSLLSILFIQTLIFYLLSILIHEGVHYFMLEQPKEICVLSIGTGNPLFYARGIGDKSILYYEFWAVLIQAIFVLSGIGFCFYRLWKKK